MAGKLQKTIEDGWYKFQFNLTMRIALYEKISSFLINNVAIHTVVQELRNEYQSYNKNDIRAYILNDIENKMRIQGLRFSAALAFWVPNTEAMVIQTGEATGAMVESFRNAIKSTKATATIMSTVRSQLQYPVILILMVLAMMWGFSTRIVPQLSSMLSVDKWPESSKHLYSFSMFINDYWQVIALGLVLILVGILSTMNSLTGSPRQLLNFVPPYSIYKSLQSSMFLITTAAMLQTGKPIFEAIDMIRLASDGYVRWELDKIVSRQTAGGSYGESFNVNGFLERESAIDVSIYSKMSALDSALETIGTNAINASVVRITTICGTVRTFAILAIGVYIGWAYQSFYTLTQSMGHVGPM